MGCFNVTGAISNSVISGGDDIVLFIGVKCAGPRISNQFAPGFEFTPIALPIFGKYDEYGGIEDIQRDANVEFLEGYFHGGIDQILRIIDDRAVDRYIESSEKNTKLCEMCETVEKSFNGYEGCIFKLATSIELRLVYDKAVSDVPHYFGFDFDKSYEKTVEVGYKEIEEIGKDTVTNADALHSFGSILSKVHDLRDKFKEKDDYYRTATYLAPWTSRNMCTHSFGYFGGGSSEYSFREYFLSLYRGIPEHEEKLFLPEMKDLFLGILKFNDWLTFNSVIFRTHNYHGQDTRYESMYNLHSALSEFYKKKVETEKEEEE